MFDALGRLVARHSVLVLLGWSAIALLLGLFAPSWEQRSQDDDIRFLPPECMSVAGHRLLTQAFPQEVFGSKAIFVFERSEQKLAAADFRLIDRVVRKLQEIRQAGPELGLGAIASYQTPLVGQRLLSADGQCTLVMVAIRTPFLAFRTADAVEFLEQELARILSEFEAKDTGPSRLSITTTGPAGIGRDLNDAAYRSLDHTTVATLILVMVTLLLVYRSPVLALVPLVTIGVSVWLSLRLLTVLSLISDFHVTSVTRIFVVVVLFGAGTDYCLFLISRYREELCQGRRRSEAVRCTLKRVGCALTASAGTVVCGLAMMGFAEFEKLRYTGPAIAVSLVLALLASLTLAPALLRLLGKWAFWPKRFSRCSRESRVAGKQRQVGECGNRFWEWMARQLAARPGLILLTSIFLLAPLAVLGYRVQAVYDFCAELPRTAPSKQGMDGIRRHFPAGEIGPLTVLLRSDKDWSTPENRELVQRLSTELDRVENVIEVRSLTQPLGKPLPFARQTSIDEAGENASPLSLLASGSVAQSVAQSLADRAARPYYVSRIPTGHVTRLDVVFRSEPFANESMRTLERVQEVIEREARNVKRDEHGESLLTQHAIYGITALTYDLAEVHEKDRCFVNTLVVAGILLILILLVRRPLVAVYLLVTVLFSYFVTLGVTELLSYGWLESNLGQVDWKVPFFLFTILVAIGEDYNIFLMARVMEEEKQHGLRLGTQRALATTGGTITSCGLIMAGTFATLTLCSLVTLVQLGLALSFGVLLDTFVVRPILVPAFLMMLGGRKAPALTQPDPVPLSEAALRRSA
jgi:RND superfamily putative drug exporter